MDYPSPPVRPDFDAKPKASPLWWLIVAFSGLFLLALVAFLATPVLWVAFAIALVIGLQYLLWGWWFERVYRARPAASDEAVTSDAAASRNKASRIE